MKACRSPLLPPDDVEVESLVLVTVQPPTPGTATPKTTATATSTPTLIKTMSRLDVQKRKKRNLATTKTKNRQSMVLANKVARSSDGDGRRKSFYRGPKKVKSIFHMIQRPAAATSPPPSAPKITFEQMYLQILEERWAYYHQLNAMREADEKREVEEYLAAHAVASAPSAPSAPTISSAPPSGRRSARQAHREARGARQAKKLPAIAEGEGEENGKVVTKTTEVSMKRAKRVTVSSPHLFPRPLSPRERLQQEEQKLKNRWRDWLRSGKKHDVEKRKLTKRGGTTTEDELKAIRAYRDADLKVAFG